MGLKVLRVWGEGFGVKDLKFRVWGEGFGVKGLKFRVWGFPFEGYLVFGV